MPCGLLLILDELMGQVLVTACQAHGQLLPAGVREVGAEEG
jgi:hypothetical protein